MSDAFWLLLLVPVFLALAVKLIFRNSIHWAEMLALVGAGALVILVGLAVSYSSQVKDTLVLNGEVTGKKYVDVSCSHSYECRCRVVDNQRRCSTCYHHAFDRDWMVFTSVGSIEIARVDWQGLSEPRRWTMVKVGEPASIKETYVNYIQASPHSLFTKPTTPVPATFSVPSYPYPSDYYRMNRVRVVGTSFPSAEAWNTELNNALRKLGPRKQLNINLIVTGLDRSYGEHLERTWAGGKKNDLTVVIGAKQWPKIDWVYAFTFARSSGNEQLVVELRELLLAPNAVDSPKLAVEDIARIATRHFKRKPMEDFKYLASEIAPGAVAISLIIFLLVLALALLTTVFSRNKLDADDKLF